MFLFNQKFPFFYSNYSMASVDHSHIEVQTNFQHLYSSPSCNHQSYVPFNTKSNRFYSNKQLQINPPIGTSIFTQGHTTYLPALITRSPTFKKGLPVFYSKIKRKNSRCAFSSLHSTGSKKSVKTHQDQLPISKNPMI